MPFPGKDKSDGELIGAREKTGDALCEQTLYPRELGKNLESSWLNGGP